MRLAAGLTLAALALAGCQVSEFATGAPQHAPIPAALERTIEKLGMTESAPILIRIYKEESKLEVWKADASGRFKFLTEYDVCAWSGELGPKFREGDRQAPEGFYSVTPGLMNPKSSYHLAFNLGYPNAFDRSLGRSGSNIMVHGDCSSRGCFAVEDKNVEEIYALAREAFAGGQRAFQVQSLPFKMTPENLARHAGSEHMPFWEMLKEGSDHFEIAGVPPAVSICKGRYVFNAKPVVGSFQATAACPAYEVDPALEELVMAKRDADDAKTETIVAGLERQKEREERWAEREQAIAAFFNTGRSGAGDLGSSEAAATAATAGVAPAGASGTTVAGSVPLPRAAPRQSAVAEAPSSGGFSLFGRREAARAMASTASHPAPAAPDGTPVATVAAVATTARTPAVVTTARAPAVVTTDPAPPPPAETATAFGYQPSETEEGFLASVAKGSRGLFRKAGDLFN